MRTLIGLQNKVEGTLDNRFQKHQDPEGHEDGMGVFSKSLHAARSQKALRTANPQSKSREPSNSELPCLKLLGPDAVYGSTCRTRFNLRVCAPTILPKTARSSVLQLQAGRTRRLACPSSPSTIYAVLYRPCPILTATMSKLASTSAEPAPTKPKLPKPWGPRT